MTRKELLKNIPSQGFIKMPAPGGIPLSPERKAVLMRKGNALFNQGQIHEAARIFITIGYTDGLIRTGDLYYRKGKMLEALRMYKAAPSPEKVNMIIEKMAFVIRGWLDDKDETENG